MKDELKGTLPEPMKIINKKINFRFLIFFVCFIGTPCFLAAVKPVMADKTPLSQLSPTQKKEYNRMIELRKSEMSGNPKTSRDFLKVIRGKASEEEEREIWHDKSLNLFKIISKRYQQAVRDERI